MTAPPEPFLWTESLAIGVPEIDRQHRALFERANAFFAASGAADPSHALGETLGFLKDYVAYHFSQEEQYMRSIGYPGLELHARTHGVLTRHLEGVATLFATEGASPAAIQVSLGLLRGWLLDHVVDVDGAIGAYARGLPAR